MLKVSNTFRISLSLSNISIEIFEIKNHIKITVERAVFDHIM